MTMLHHADDSLIEGLARVVAVDRDQVWLTAEQPAACGSCATRSACGAGHATPAGTSWRAPRAFGQGQAQTLLALGDTVHVGVDRAALTHATLVAYTLPLLTMLLAAGALQSAGDGVAIAAALAGLMTGVALARRLARRWSDALKPLVLGRATSHIGSACVPDTAGALRRVLIPVVQQGSR